MSRRDLSKDFIEKRNCLGIKIFNDINNGLKHKEISDKYGVKLSSVKRWFCRGEIFFKNEQNGTGVFNKLPVMVERFLRKGGYKDIDIIKKTSDKDLLKVNGIGKKYLKIIREAL